MKNVKITIENKKSMVNLVAILSTTVIPKDGVYLVERIESFDSVNGMPHYIGHPDTKEIVENLGAVQSESKLFKGLKDGESALTFAIKQGFSNRGKDGFSSPHQAVTMDMLDIRVITKSSLCAFCNETRGFGWHCSSCGGT